MSPPMEVQCILNSSRMPQTQFHFCLSRLKSTRNLKKVAVHWVVRLFCQFCKGTNMIHFRLLLSSKAALLLSALEFILNQ